MQYQGDGVTNNERKVAEFLNNAYINVENTAGKKPLSVLDKDVIFSTAINTVLEEYQYHPSVLAIRKLSEKTKCFSFF